MARIDPAIGPAGKGIRHAVRVDVPVLAVEDLLVVSFSVTIPVVISDHVGNAVDDRAVVQRKLSDRDVQATDKCGDFGRATIGTDALDHGDPVLGLEGAGAGELLLAGLNAITFNGVGVLD